MATIRETKTWRVRGINLRCQHDCLQQLISQIPGHDSQIESLAIEYRGQSKTATVSFPVDVTPPKSLPSCVEHHQLSDGAGGKIVFDEQFLDFTTLFAPPEEDCELE